MNSDEDYGVTKLNGDRSLLSVLMGYYTTKLKLCRNTPEHLF